MKGITVKLLVKTETGKDPFGVPVYDSHWADVENVLPGQPTEQEVLDSINLYGKKCVYTLGIPKGDTHDWNDTEVEFFGERFRTIGHPIMGIDKLVPTAWNKKVRVESEAADGD